MNNALKQKIICLLSAGIAFAYSYTPSQKYKALKVLGREWQKINKEEFDISISR